MLGSLPVINSTLLPESVFRNQHVLHYMLIAITENNLDNNSVVFAIPGLRLTIIPLLLLEFEPREGLPHQRLFDHVRRNQILRRHRRLSACSLQTICK